MPLTFLEFCAVTAIMILGTVVQGSIGFGLAVVVAPVLLLFDPSFVPGPILVTAVVLTMLMAHRDRHAIHRRALAVASVGRIFGAVPAAYAVTAMSRGVFDLVFGSMVFAAVVLSAVHWHVFPTTRNVFIASIISGFTGTVAAIGGPPLALVYQHEEGDALRGTLSSIFMIGGTISLASLWYFGSFGWHEAQLGVALLPGSVVGFVASHWTVRILDRGWTRPAVLVLSGAAATAVLWRALF